MNTEPKLAIPETIKEVSPDQFGTLEATTVGRMVMIDFHPNAKDTSFGPDAILITKKSDGSNIQEIGPEIREKVKAIIEAALQMPNLTGIQVQANIFKDLTTQLASQGYGVSYTREE